jgi:cell division septation protein DedD
MGHFSRTAHRPTFRSALAIFGVTIIASAFLFAGANTAAAAKAKAKPGAPAAPVTEAEQKQKDAAQTRQAYDAGVKSYSAGKFQPAVDELSGALRAGGLSSAEMAKALYVRGMAYKRLNKPGLAISDLTSALWLKNGLGEGDQKNAIAERAESYRMAGLGDGNSGKDAVSVADPNPAPAGAKAAAPAAAPVVAVPANSKKAAKAAAIAPAAGPPNPPAAVAEVTRQAPDSQAAIDAANARKLASTPVETGGLQSAAVGSLIGDQGRASQPAAVAAAPAAVSAQAPVAEATPAIPAPIPATAAAPTPVLAAVPMDAAPAAASTGGALNSVTGFFSNMFSGGGKTAAATATAPVASALVTTASTSPTSATSSWTDSTSVANGASKKAAAAPAAQVAAVAVPAAAAPAAAAPAVKGGKYKIHIAAVRSKAEAEALAQKLSAQNGAALKSRSPVVDEAVIGSMGTFYRVRVGSYATAEEPRGVCNTLRASGFDCLVVTN